MTSPLKNIVPELEPKYSQDATSHQRALERSCTGAGSGMSNSSGPRAWRSWWPSHPHHQIPLSRGGKFISSALWLYHRLRQRLSTPPQPFPDHQTYPLIGQPTAFIHPHHTSLGSARRERLQQRPPCFWHTSTRTLTQPATPLWGKPRNGIGSRPPT